MKSRLQQRENRPQPSRTLAEEAYGMLRYAIVEGHLGPGTHLEEVILSERLKIGRTPVREALMHLAADGLVERTRNVGFFVPHFTIEEIEETYAVRCALECLAVRLAIQRGFSGLKLAELTRLCDALEAAGRKKDRRLMCLLDMRFHRALVSLANSRRIESFVRGHLLQIFAWSNLVKTKEQQDSLKKTVRAHREIVKSLRDRDPDRAVEILSRHIGLISGFLARISSRTQKVKGARLFQQVKFEHDLSLEE